MYTNDKNGTLEMKENNKFTFNGVVEALKKMSNETLSNLSDLQKHQNSTSTKIINSYIDQIKSYQDILGKKDITETQVKDCFDGIDKINSKMESIKHKDDLRVKEDKGKWLELGKTVVKIIGSFAIVATIVKGAPEVIKSITKR